MALDPNQLSEIEKGSQQGASLFSSENLGEIEDSSQLAAPTFGEKAEEAALGVAEGTIRGGTTLGTGLLGARAGATAGAMFPVFGPATPAIGGAVGFVGGVTAGYLASQPMADWFPIPSREDLVPYREGGKTTGEVIGASPVAFGIPQMTANKVARFLSMIGETSRKYPGRFLAAETTAGISSGIAGGAAVQYAPDSPGTRFVAELGAGLFAPGKLFINGSSAAKDFLVNFASSFSQGAREARAANVLRAALIEAGEDPNEVIKMLQRETFIDPQTGETIKLTAGQKTGVPVLNALESTLAKRHAQYAGTTKEQGERALQAYKLLIQRLEDIGDPQALRQAAVMRDQYLNSVLEARLNAAHADAAVKISRINRGDTPGVRREIGQIVKTEIDDALKEARGIEKELWTNAFRQSFQKRKVLAPENMDVFSPDFGYHTKNAKGQSVWVGYDPKEAAKVDFEALRAADDRIGKGGEFLPNRVELPAKYVTQVTPRAVDTNNLFRSYLDYVSGITPERLKYRVPAEIRTMMERMGIDEVDIARYRSGRRTPEFLETGIVPDTYLPKNLDKAPVDDLINIRSDLLSFSRDAAARGEASDASFYGRLAESALDDLSQINVRAYDQARSYSRALNDTFTRTFAGETQAVKKTGAEKLPAEVLVSNAFGRNADMTALRMEQMEDAAGFIQSQYQAAREAYGPNSQLALTLKQLLPGANNRIVSIQDAQTRVMRVMAADAVDLNTGRLNVNRLINFAKQNKPTLDRLGITPDLEDAAKAENFYRSVMDQNSKINTNLRKQTAFAQVLEFESPSRAIGAALNSRFPVKNFSRIAKLARSGGQDAIDGMKSSVYDYVFTKALGKNGTLDPRVLEEAMFSPIAPNQPSIYNILRSQGLMTMQEAKNLKRLIDPMKKIQTSLERGQAVDEIVAGADAITDLALRVAGAKLGTAVAPQGPGVLIAAAAGSKAVRSVFDKIPNMSITRIIEDATKDPALMARLLATSTLPREKVRMGRSLHAYLTAAGYNYADYEEPPEEALVTRTTGPTAAQMLRQTAPVAPPTKGVPGFDLPLQRQPGGPLQQGAPAAAPAMGPRSEAPSSSRQMLASLFPFDTISGMGG